MNTKYIEVRRLVDMFLFADSASELSLDELVEKSKALGFDIDKPTFVTVMKDIYREKGPLPDWLQTRISDLMAGPNWKD
ncbi:hypothetical protein ACDW_00320 [Acidovorax sp. DW039]|uniref:hypothetical protein n=1 Tax=Acidovorax sp. DW039 TaxID=3095606 RepID=UPI00309185BF|nr:hypothetical protein ACDW_00320 [Acidovorax sp. DW039]